MNAAARVLHQESVFRGRIKIALSKEFFGILILLVAVLVSALSVIYVKNLDRRVFSELQTAQQTSDRLKIEWGQLLLEQSTWATPARVQNIAQTRFNMVLPSPENVVMVKL